MIPNFNSWGPGLSVPRGTESQPLVPLSAVPAEALLTSFSSFCITAELPPRVLQLHGIPWWAPDSWAWSWGPMSAGSEPLQVHGCLMNAEHRASGAFAKGVREKVYVQSKAKHSISLLLITSLSWVLCWWKGTEVVRTHMCMCMHTYTQTHTHNPHKEWKKKIHAKHSQCSAWLIS